MMTKSKQEGSKVNFISKENKVASFIIHPSLQFLFVQTLPTENIVLHPNN